MHVQQLTGATHLTAWPKRARAVVEKRQIPIDSIARLRVDHGAVARDSSNQRGGSKLHRGFSGFFLQVIARDPTI